MFGDGRQVRNGFAQFHAALAMPAELERAGQQHVGIVGLMDLDPVRVRLSGPLRQLGLGIEQVHLAGAAVLDELDHRLRRTRKVAVPRLQVVVGEAVLFGFQHAAEGHAAHAESTHFQQFAAGDGMRKNVPDHGSKSLSPVDLICPQCYAVERRLSSRPDRVGRRGLRPCTLPHHRTYRFQYPAVGVTRGPME